MNYCLTVDDDGDAFTDFTTFPSLSITGLGAKHSIALAYH